MTLIEAAQHIYKPAIYSAMCDVLSPPEILRAMAYQCFLHNQEDGIEDTIRAACIIFEETGIMSQPIKPPKI